MNFCPGCGADLRSVDSIGFCPACGIRLAVPSSSVRAASPVDNSGSTSMPARKSPPVALLAIGGAVALLAAVVVVALASSGGAADATKGDPASETASGGRSGPASTPEEPASPPPPKPELPKWSAVRVHRVQMASSSVAWDGPKQRDRTLKDYCQGIAEVANLVGKGKALGIACGIFGQSEQEQSDPREPDLQVVLEAPRVRYKSHIATDRRSQLFDYAFVVPLGDHPKTGHSSTPQNRPLRVAGD